MGYKLKITFINCFKVIISFNDLAILNLLGIRILAFAKEVYKGFAICS